jgi:hypothetical protein
MKKLSYILTVLLMAFATQAFGQVNLDELAAAIEEDEEGAAALVEEAVAANPSQAEAIMTALLTQFPGLAQGIVFGVIAGMPAGTSNTEIANLVGVAVSVSPAQAAQILAGARLAAGGNQALMAQIVSSIRTAVRGLSSVPVAPGPPGSSSNETIRISPSRPSNNLT